jgi:phosphonate transport system ATP-binding protein
MLRIEDLTKTYPGEKVPALGGISLEVNQGEFVAILGRSGAGKSTLIRCVNRLVEPDKGKISWDGKAITGIGARELRNIRGEIGMVFQHFHLLPRVSVLTNVLAGAFAVIPLWRSLLWSYTAEQKKQALKALEQVGLDHLASRRVEELSGGQQQRVAIARVLMQKPKLLLGDEPVSSLDPVTSERVMQFMGKLHQEQGMTIILNLHDVNLARKHATRLIGLSKGKLVFDGKPSELGDAELAAIYPNDESREVE